MLEGVVSHYNTKDQLTMKVLFIQLYPFLDFEFSMTVKQLQPSADACM